MNLLINADARQIPLADGSVNCIVTSPPYYGLRDYGTARWEGGDPNCDHNPQRHDGGWRADRTLPLGRGGVVFDPFVGSGTTIMVANQLGRRGVGLDLSFKYLHEDAKKRIEAVQPKIFA